MKNIEFVPMDRNVLEDVLKSYGLTELLTLSGEQLDRMKQFADQMLDMNTKMNLTGIIDSEGVADKHFADSLLLLKYLPIKEDAKVIDVGTGAGFPALPCMLARPDLKFTLLDGLQKRITFLQSVCDSLKIKAEALHGRAEEIARKAEYREQYDVATARAVADLRILCEYCLPLVKVGGYFIAMKGDGEKELDGAMKAIEKLGGEFVENIQFTLPDTSKRSLIICKKVKSTPSTYPRNGGKINKSPL